MSDTPIYAELVARPEYANVDLMVFFGRISAAAVAWHAERRAALLAAGRDGS